MGKVVPSKAQDWLFEDIVHLDTMRREEYDYYVKILLYFLDPEKVKGKLAAIDADLSRSFFKPESPDYFNSDRVIDIQRLLTDVLENDSVRTKLIASICAVERCSFRTQAELGNYDSSELANILISARCLTKKCCLRPCPISFSPATLALSSTTIFC